MRKLATKLRIGEKVGLVFGIVALIFLGVIGQYHASLHRVLSDYRALNAVYGARKSYAFEIESRLAAMRRAEGRFLLSRDMDAVANLHRDAEALLAAANALAEVDSESEQTAERLKTLTRDYTGRFDAIVDAWQTKGLDHDSGLQGAFRERVHKLEAHAGHYDVDRPYLLLMQVRRAEKDLGLRREVQYQRRAHQLLDEMATTVAASNLDNGMRERLAAEIADYRHAFDAYTERVLAGNDIQGGKGPFRQIAHRIEDIFIAHQVPDMEAQILQLRRREKDYLLRGDQKYVEMVGEIARDIRGRIDAATIAESEKTGLLDLLGAYERDFLALVEQNRRIDTLAAEMHQAADRITPLVEENLAQADHAFATMSQRIEHSSSDSARRNLIIAFAALAIGALLSFMLTARIVRPVREMAGLLDRLTHENPVQRMATDPNGRDEINAMAGSLNTMADHKATFFNWWRTSMQEAIAMRDLGRASAQGEWSEAAEELRTAALSQVQQLNAIRGQAQRHLDDVDQIAERLATDPKSIRPDDGLKLRNAAASAATLLRVVDENGN